MYPFKIFIGNPYYANGIKRMVEITDYIENKTIEIEETSNNTLPIISSIEFTVQNNKDLLPEDIYNFLQSHTNFSMFPLIITNKDYSILFNGVIQMVNTKVHGNYRYSDNKTIMYTFSNIIHKGFELKHKYLSNAVSSREVKIDNYLNYLLENNSRVTKYKDYEVYDSAVSEILWGYPSSYIWGKAYEGVFWGEKLSNKVLPHLVIDKSKIYNVNAINIGDTVHITTRDSEGLHKSHHVIKEITNFYEVEDRNHFIDYLILNNMSVFQNDLEISVSPSGLLQVHNNGNVISSGQLDNSWKATLTGLYSGEVQLNRKYLMWGRYTNEFWGQNIPNTYWGKKWGQVENIKVNASKLVIKTFNNITIPIGATDCKTIIGWEVESLDSTSEVLVANSLVVFEPVLSLIDNLSNSYMFNYSLTNNGIINLYTNTAEDTMNEDYILAIGNNPRDLIEGCGLSNTNCLLKNNLGDIITNVVDLEGLMLYSQNLTQPFNSKLTLTNLEEGKQYILSLDTNADSIDVTYNNTTPIDLVELDYYRTPKFKFTAPTGITSLEIILGGNIGTPSITINELFVKDFYYTDAEYDAIYAPIEVQSDSSGLRTALHVQNYKQTKQNETIEQILSIAPAQNTYHRIVEDEITNPSETLSTGTGDTQYITLGRGISSLTFPILTDKDTFINNINLNLFRTTFGTNDCVLVSFVRNTAERIFAQIIPQSQIETSLQIQPAFLHKKSLDKLECILYAKRRDSSRTITNSQFTTTNSEWYVPNEKVFIIDGASLVEPKILSVVGNLVTLEGSYNLTSDVMANKDNTATGTYLELECTTIFDDTDDYLIMDDTLNSSLALVRETTIQNAYVCRLPISNIGASYNGTPEQVYIKYNNEISATFSIVDKNGAPSTFVNAQPDFFDKILDYDLVYLRLFNTSTNKYEVVRLKSYNTTNNTITLWDEVNLSNFAYEVGSTKIIEFARIFITTTGTFEAKATDDAIYEAYITSDRYSFGFNNKVDVQAIDYLLKNNTTKKFGRIYDIGNILTAVYDISLSFPRYLENVDAIEQYGTILEEPMTDELTDLNTFIISTDNSLKYNASPTTSTTVTAHLDFLADLKPNEDIYKAKLVRLYNEVLESGLYSIENKKFVFNKNNINLCELILEKLV